MTWILSMTTVRSLCLTDLFILYFMMPSGTQCQMVGWFINGEMAHGLICNRILPFTWKNWWKPRKVLEYLLSRPAFEITDSIYSLEFQCSSYGSLNSSCVLPTCYLMMSICKVIQWILCNMPHPILTTALMQPCGDSSLQNRSHRCLHWLAWVRFGVRMYEI